MDVIDIGDVPPFPPTPEQLAQARAALYANYRPVLRPLGFEAVQIFSARMDSQHATAPGGDTQEMAIELMARSPLSATAPKAIVGQSRSVSTPGSTGVQISMQFVSQLSDLDGVWGGVNANFFGTVANTLPFMAAVDRQFIQWTDPALTPPVARADGRTKPLLAIRANLAQSSSNLAISGADGVDLSNWATRPALRVRQRQHSTPGDQRTASNWGTTSVEVSKGIVIGAAFTHDTPVVNVLTGPGDSISEGSGGSGITYQAESFGQLACEALNTEGHKCQFVNSAFGWSNQNSNQFIQRFIDLLNWGVIPDVTAMICGSPNDTPGAGAALTSSTIDLWRYNTGRFLALCASKGIVPVLGTVLKSPFHTGWGVDGNARRVAWNQEVLSYAARGIAYVFDADTLVGDNIGDTIHPNNVGKAAIATGLADQLRLVAGGNL